MVYATWFFDVLIRRHNFIILHTTRPCLDEFILQNTVFKYPLLKCWLCCMLSTNEETKTATFESPFLICVEFWNFVLKRKEEKRKEYRKWEKKRKKGEQERREKKETQRNSVIFMHGTRQEHSTVFPFWVTCLSASYATRSPLFENKIRFLIIKLSSFPFLIFLLVALKKLSTFLYERMYFVIFRQNFGNPYDFNHSKLRV